MGGELTNPNKLDKEVLSIFAVGDNSYGNISFLNKKELNIKRLFLDNFYQCFAIDNNNNLFSWGLNDYYQLANGKNSKYLFNTNDTDSKKTNENNFSIISKTSNNALSKTIKNIFYSSYNISMEVSKIKSITCGDGFTLFLTTEGLVYSVGRNDKGQLGYELDNNSSQIVDGIKCNDKLKLIEYFSKNKINIDKIICGADFCFALENVGLNEEDDLDDIDNINEGIYCWGNNELNQLGIEENKYKYYFNPTKADLVIKTLKKQKTTISKLICGWSHSCLLTKNNNIYLWGNPFKEYNKKYKNIKEPIIINEKNNAKIIDVSSGFNHIAILSKLNIRSKIECYTFGANEFGQLGYPTDELYIDRFNKVEIPKTELNENLKIKKIRCGAHHTLLQLGENLIYGFGQNNCKQIGNYHDEFLTSPKKWNYIMENNNEKFLYDIKCSNGISCLLFKYRQEIKEEKIEEKNKDKIIEDKSAEKIMVNSLRTENAPLNKII